MLGRSLFRIPAHQKFDYKPRYWNPEKERVEELRERIRSIQSEDVEGTKARITSKLRSRYASDPRLRSRLTRQSNIRVIVIIAILVVLCYFLYTSNLDKIISLLT